MTKTNFMKKIEVFRENILKHQKAWDILNHMTQKKRLSVQFYDKMNTF